MDLLLGFGLVFASLLALAFGYALSRHIKTAEFFRSEAFASAVALFSTVMLGLAGAAFSWFYEDRRAQLEQITPPDWTALAIVTAIAVLVSFRAFAVGRRHAKGKSGSPVSTAVPILAAA